MVSQETYDDIKQKYDELEAKYESNLVYINYLQRHLFGKTSERHVPSPVNELQDSLFPNEAPTETETVIVEKELITYERSKKVAVKHPGRKPLNENLPRQVIEYFTLKRIPPRWSASVSR